MKRLIITVLIALTLTGCGGPAETDDQTSDYRLPQELVKKGCKVYRMKGEGNLGAIKVVYCPNSSTTTSHQVGKSGQSNTTVISGGNDGE